MEERIKELRQVAMDVLKPSKADLEHGLELHRSSVVIDSYGFSPSTVVDYTRVREAVEAGAGDAEFKDTNEDTMMIGKALNADYQAEFMAAWEAAGVTCIFQNAGEECFYVDRVLKRLGRYTYLTDAMRGRLDRAVRPADVTDAKQRGAHCLLMSANSVPMAQRWTTVEEELAYIRLFFQLGVRMMHVTYNRRNMLGDGCAETANGGLSDLGRQAVREMNDIGVIIDVAHSGWQTSLEAAQASEKPMVASHSCCAALNAHIRSKPDEVIGAIADTGGYMGVCCIAAFLGGSGDLNALLDHIDHVVRTFGAEHVAIGTDAAFTSPRAAAERKSVPARGRRRGFIGSFWPADDPMFDPKWRNNPAVASLDWMNWPMYTVGLVQRGHSDDDIRKIIGGNVLRVLDAVLDTELGRPLGAPAAG